MSELLDNLYKLHLLDTKLKRIHDRMITLPKRTEVLEQRFQRRKEEIVEHQENLTSAEVERKKIELDIEQAEEKINTYQNQLQKVKTNEEYRGLEAQIEFQKSKINNLETQEIELLDKIDQYQDELNEFEKRMENEQQRYEQEKEKLQKEKVKSDQIITELEQQKQQISQIIPPRFLKKYERIRNAKGTAVAVISEMDLNTPPTTNDVWICGGCNSTLPPQIVEEVKMNTKMITCEVCGRILYYDRDEI